MEALAEIHARLRAADVALAQERGGSSELASVREAAGSLLVALHALVGLYEAHLLAPAEAAGHAGAEDVGAPAARRRGRGGRR